MIQIIELSKKRTYVFIKNGESIRYWFWYS